MKKLTDKITFRHGATINNRIVQTPMLTNSGVNEMVTDTTLKYYDARSKSAGMVIVEYTNASINGGPSRSWPEHEQLAIYDDKFIPGLTKVAEVLKKDGNKALIQLCHAGREAEYGVSLGRRLEVPSIVDYPWIKVPLYEMSEEEVWQVVKDFGTATKRAIECGFDGVEIHGANHYLIQQFFSAFSNRRTDYWGGSVEKRMNFAIEVSREVLRVAKEYGKEDFIVGYRISPEEIHGENIGYTWHESQLLIEKLTSMFDFDYIHFSLVQYNSKPEYNDSDKALIQLMCESVKNDTLTIVAGGVHTVEKMKDALNYVDMAGLGRPTLIDPQIGYKIENGLEDTIYLEFNEESVKAGKLTPGMIELLANIPEFEMAGTDYLKSVSKLDLGDDVTHY